MLNIRAIMLNGEEEMKERFGQINNRNSRDISKTNKILLIPNNPYPLNGSLRIFGPTLKTLLRGFHPVDTSSFNKA
jgi:hypothetical protein